jgi:hypothetical protein
MTLRGVHNLSQQDFFWIVLGMNIAPGLMQRWALVRLRDISFGLRAIWGFGGLLPSDFLYMVTRLSRGPIPRTTADLLTSPSLSVT